MTGMRSLLYALLLVVAVSGAGFLVTMTLSDGLAPYRDEPARAAVARRALEGVRRLNDAPGARIFLPLVRVESVARKPGSCPTDDPTARDSLADYVAHVRTYTWYRIPVGAMEAWCGGRAYGPKAPAAPATTLDGSPLPTGRALPAVQIASARADLDADGAQEDLELLAEVELDRDGDPIWEDGHWWALLVRDSTQTHRLVHEFVAMGRLTAWIVQPDQESPIIVVERESGTAGVEVRAFRHDGRGGYADAGRLDATGRPLARLGGERTNAGSE